MLWLLCVVDGMERPWHPWCIIFWRIVDSSEHLVEVYKCFLHSLRLCLGEFVFIFFHGM